VYAREVDGQVLSFGVSGLLWNDNVLMYDRQSESLWSQVKREAVAGPRTGARLRVLPSTVTTWEKWRRRHPETLVLTTDTGHRRDYTKDPYEDYYRSKRGMFSVFRGGPGEKAKELVVGVELDGVARAYPVSHVRNSGHIRDRVGTTDLVVRLDPETDMLQVITANGEPVEALVTYWMVWKGVHPDSSQYTSRD
jgi:hypothetical protein